MAEILTFITCEEGTTALEYGVMAALIAAVIVFAITALGIKLQGIFSNAESQIPALGS